MSNPSSPADLMLVNRNRRCGRNADAPRWWAGGDPVATAFFNALSMTFPAGEAFFIEAVRHYRSSVSPDLAAQINQFIAQEIAHTREHVALNRQVALAGYDTARMDSSFRARIDRARGGSPLAKLAATTAMEHLTAIMGHAVLKDPRHLAGATAGQRDLWLWHCIEEVEHKGVAFDTLVHAMAGKSPWQRWLLRSIVMARVTRNFWERTFADMADFLAQDGIAMRRAWPRVLWFLFGNPGLVRQMVPLYLAWFKPGFHPWQHDDRGLINAGEAQLTPPPRSAERAAA